MGKGFWELFGDSISEYGSKFVIILKTFLFLYLIPFVIFGLVIWGVLSANLGGKSSALDLIASEGGIQGIFNIAFGNWAAMGAMIVLFIVIFLLAIVFIVLLYSSFINISFAKDGKIGFKKVFNTSKKYFWKYLGLGIVLAILLTILYLLLVIPGIIFTVYWAFAAFILIKENVNIGESMKRSKALVRGKWWRVFGYLLLVYIIYFIVAFVVGFIPIFADLVSMLVLTPFVVIFLKNFYLELKTK